MSAKGGRNSEIGGAIGVIAFALSKPEGFTTQELSDFMRWHRSTSLRWLRAMEGYYLLRADRGSGYIKHGRTKWHLSAPEEWVTRARQAWQERDQATRALLPRDPPDRRLQGRPRGIAIGDHILVRQHIGWSLGKGWRRRGDDRYELRDARYFGRLRDVAAALAELGCEEGATAAHCLDQLTSQVELSLTRLLEAEQCREQ